MSLLFFLFTIIIFRNFATKVAKFFDLKVQSVGDFSGLGKKRNKFLCFALNFS